MKKQVLIESVLTQARGLKTSVFLSKRDANLIVNSLFRTLSKVVVKEGRAIVPGFGTFVVRTRRARTGRNPQTQQEIQLPASKTVGFKPAPTLRRSL